MSSALLRIYLKQNATYGKSVHEAVLKLLRDSGISGATLLRGIKGYGTNGKYLENSGAE